MPLLFGRIRGRKALAWLKHRRWWQWNKSGPGGPFDTRITSQGDRRVTDLAFVRVIRPGTLEGFVRLQEDGATQRLEEDGTVRYTEDAA